MELTICRKCTGIMPDNCTVPIPLGAIVQYVGHFPGGTVQVIFHGTKCFINPLCTRELS